MGVKKYFMLEQCTLAAKCIDNGWEICISKIADNGAPIDNNVAEQALKAPAMIRLLAILRNMNHRVVIATRRNIISLISRNFYLHGLQINN